MEDPRVRLVHVLHGLRGPWGEQDLRQIHRLLRDPSAAVWEAACAAAGARSSTERGARRELLALLGSESEEMRVRGLEALGYLEDFEAIPFLQARVQEAGELGDAALMNAAAAALARLSEPDLAAMLWDSRDLVRAAAAAWLPDGLMDRAADLARDPSSRVRVALATHAPRLPDAALWLLAADTDPVVRQALAEELPRDRSASLPFLEILQADADPLVQAAARTDAGSARPVLPPADAGPWARLRELEAELDSHPHRVLELLRPWAADPETLNSVAQVARDPEIAALARAFALLAPVAGLPRSLAREKVLQALGSLPPSPESDPVVRFRVTAMVALRAAEAGTPEAMEVWAADVNPWAVLPAAREPLERMAQLASGLREPTCASLSAVVSSLEDLRAEVARECPDPERSLLRLALEVQAETLEERIADMLSGAAR